MNRRIQFSIGEWYHCYNRGVDKRKTFLSTNDYERFLALLYLGNSPEPVRMDNLLQSQQGPTLLGRVLDEDRAQTLVDIGAYCLMPNHFHLLIREKQSGGLTEFMRKITTGYTMYFNKKTDRTGALFGGTFKAKHVHDDRYLKRLFNYIHANCAELVEPRWKEGEMRNRHTVREFISSYAYSSFSTLTATPRTSVNAIIDLEAVSDLFEESPTVNDLLEDAITFARTEDIAA